MRSPKDGEIRKTIREALGAGCTVDDKPTGNNHGVLRGPDGRVITRFPLGTTDYRSGRNLKAEIRRALQGVRADT